MTNRFSFTTANFPIKGKNGARNERRAKRELTFVGVDGEGVNVEKHNNRSHRYVMLSVGSETLWRNGRELSHHDIFPFLYDQHLTDKSAVFVGFFLGYDFAMWLKSISEHEAWMLWSREGIAKRRRTLSGGNTVPFPVYVGDEWEIDILGMKRFKLRPSVDIGTKNPHTWMSICDTGAFFQTSFMKAVNPSQWPSGNQPCTPDEYAIIGEGKAKRADVYAEGDTSYLSDMVRYNQLENTVLARTMSVLNAGFVASGVRLQKDEFYGPGQSIQKWLDGQVSRGLHLAHKDMEVSVPAFALNAGTESYYGGRFELFYHGHIPGKVHEYDITSAYPHAMRLLPCLCSTDWREVQSDSTSRHVVGGDDVFVYGTFRSKDHRVACLPWRSVNGKIRYPSEVRGWYVASEVQNAVAHNLLDIDIERRIVAGSSCGHSEPLAGIADLFAYRKTLSKTSAHGKAIKLMINSAYGKFAQSIGNPKYGNPIYASLITSKCREMILTAIATHPDGLDSVVMAATDGVYFRSEHTGLVLDPRLGGWEHEEKNNLTVMKPGVYWDDKARKQLAAGDDVTIKSRGISGRTLAANIGSIDAAFTALAQPGAPWKWPELNITIPFTVTSPLLAIARGKWGTCGRVEYDQDRRESGSLGFKRDRPRRNPDGTIQSFVWQHEGENAATTAYSKRFGFDDIVGTFTEGWGLTPYGDASDVVTDIVNL